MCILPVFPLPPTNTCIILAQDISYIILPPPPPVQEGEADDDDADKRVSVIETSTGNKLTGEEAPMKKDLEQWLQEHPG